MQIQHNIAALNATRQLGINNSAASKSLEKLSSGFRINRSGDDAAGLAISEKMRAQISGLEQSQRNAQDGISMIQTAEGALTEVHSMLNRMKELSVQAANGTYDDTVDRAALNAESTQLKSEIDNILTNTKFNDIALLDGTLNVNIQIGVSSAETLAMNLTTTDISGVGTITLDTQANANTAVDTITDDINLVSTFRAQLGALQNRLEHSVNNIGVAAENVTAAESRIRDVDMAKEMMNFTKNNILMQAAQSMLAQANSQPQGVLQLLR